MWVIAVPAIVRSDPFAARGHVVREVPVQGHGGPHGVVQVRPVAALSSRAFLDLLCRQPLT